MPKDILPTAHHITAKTDCAYLERYPRLSRPHRGPTNAVARRRSTIAERRLACPYPNMLLSKDAVDWKAARARLPPSRVVWNFVTGTRFLLAVALVGVIILIWDGVSGTAGDIQR